MMYSMYGFPENNWTTALDVHVDLILFEREKKVNLEKFLQ